MMPIYNEKLAWFLNNLPPLQRVWRRSEPDFYGASYTISHLLGKKTTPVSFASWRHGWIYFDPIIHPRLVSNGTPYMMNLVATEYQEEVLKDFGYKKVYPVGLPYIYGNLINSKRKPDSLLVMPGHTLPYTDHQWDQKNYVNQIVALKPYFSTIVACIHSSCFEKGYWVTDFEKHDIPCIKGADSYDKYALLRLNCLFHSFDYMTTNSIGSHVAYAAFSGCKVSIYGDYASPAAEDYSHDPYWKMFPELLHFWIKNSTVEIIRKNYPEFFIHPREASDNSDWGAQMVGLKFKRKPTEIAELLGWSFKNQICGYAVEGKRLLRDPKALRHLFRRRKIAKSN